MRRSLFRVPLVLLCVGIAQPGFPQEPPRGATDSASLSSTTAHPGSREERSPDGAGGLKAFVKDVGGDYKRFFSKETANWYAIGVTSSGFVHMRDEEIRATLEDPPEATQTALEGGDKYGNLSLQVPLAVGWWVTGYAVHSARAADAGRDLLRAQISAASWGYVLKFAVDRTRPNGDPRSFPSGHAAATFATATVLQAHYGWKLGVPFFAAAAYTAVSRISVNKHWASDVTMGAFVGIASARTVTLHLRNRRFSLAPFPARGGGGIAFVAVE